MNYYEDFNLYQVIDILSDTSEAITDRQLKALIDCQDISVNEYLFQKSRNLTDKIFGREIYLRGLIEISNYCKNDCYYCGLRCSNKEINRYRMSKNEILECCEKIHSFGLRTFVLQAGEDTYFTDSEICSIISEIRNRYKDSAITLSLGEKSKDSYQKYFRAGADRYLLRQESSNPEYYIRLHPVNMSCKSRLQSQKDLQWIGYQLGMGFMVDSPYQTVHDLCVEIRYMQEMKPQMIGIGPFIAHHNTPFWALPNGSVDLTIRIIAILRLLMPNVLLPATTALESLASGARINALNAGANVIMPNFTPVELQGNYQIYDGKYYGNITKRFNELRANIEKNGYTIAKHRGDHKDFV